MSRDVGWSAVGGHVVLDLVNTVSWRADPARVVDHLTQPSALLSWATAMALQPETAEDDDAMRAALRRIRELRRLVGTALDELTSGRPPDHQVLAELGRRYQSACATAELAPGLPLHWAISPTTTTRLAARLELEAGDLLQRPDLHLVRRCEDSGCGWLFLDTTRNHSRRWCTSADCGNRARVRRHSRATKDRQR